MAAIAFVVVPSPEGYWKIVTPRIDGQSIAILAEAYERQMGYDDPPGGYGGVEAWSAPDLRDNYLGQPDPHDPGCLIVSCECGEPGCWSLRAQIEIGPDAVIWRNFLNPHRPARNYDGFGPFEFARSDYVAALETMGRALEA